MSEAKNRRTQKHQLGQFLTPRDVARKVIDLLPFNPADKVLEPSFGTGSFIYAYVDRARQAGVNIESWAEDHLAGCELDHTAYDEFARNWHDGKIPAGLCECDFFRYKMPSFNSKQYFVGVKAEFDLVIGNPPFGGTIDSEIQDELDNIYGFRNGDKIKKETYSFFIVKCLDLLKKGGRLAFICSDTLLSINTMSGLRRYLMSTCKVEVHKLPGSFEDTQQPMIVLVLTLGGHGVTVFGEEKPIDKICRTANASWMINDELVRFFTGKTLGDYFVATSGMTVGKNEYFLREIVNGGIEEPYEFEIIKRPISLADEIEKARLGKISERKRQEIAEREARGDTESALRVVRRAKPKTVSFPDADYAPYNKATNKLIYAAPKCAIFWKDDGKYVYTFKKAGPWYLHGVGGKPYFKREGLTWQLISSHLNMRYLPAGYILDSGAPCAFPRPGVPQDEMYFVMGWCLTKRCNEILKKVINHTRNIQSKDFERLPYPTWVSEKNRSYVVAFVKEMISEAKRGREYAYSSPELSTLDTIFAAQCP